MKILRAGQSEFDQAFACQVSIHCIDKQHNILMSASYANRVGHFWASQNKSFRSLGTEVWEHNIYIWVFYKDFYMLQLLFMYSFTHTNIAFLFKYLPTEIFIFKNVYY